MKPKQVLPLWVREDLRVKKRSSKLPRSQEMGPHNQIEFSFIPSKPLFCGGDLPLCKGYSWCICPNDGAKGVKDDDKE